MKLKWYGHYNYVKSLQGDPQVITDSAPRTVGGVKIHGLACFHDEAQGAKRGPNIAFILEGDGLRVAHLGDLGHLPTPEMYEALRGVDILLIPIGGTYTTVSYTHLDVYKRQRQSPTGRQAASSPSGASRRERSAA